MATTNAITEKSNIYATPLTAKELETFWNITGISAQAKAIGTLVESVNSLKNEIVNIQRDQQLMANKTNDMFTDIINGLIASQDKVADTIKYQHEKNRKQIFAITSNSGKEESSINPIFYSTANVALQKSWRKIIEGDIEKLVLNTGANKLTIYKDLYARMKIKGHDVNALLKEYREEHPSASIMDMCMASDILRVSMSAQLEIMEYTNTSSTNKKLNVANKTKAKSNKKLYLYVQANRSPAEIRSMIANIGKNGVWSPTMSKKVYDALRKTVDVDSIVSNFNNNNRISKCNKWFAISKDKKAMEELNRIISEHKEF